MKKTDSKRQPSKPWRWIAAACIAVALVCFYPATLSLRGKVLDQDGAPVNEAEVVCSLSVPFSWKAYRRTGRTDAEGQFRISCFKPFAYFIKAQHPDYVTLPQWTASSSASTSNSPKQPGLTLILLKAGSAEPVIRKASRSYSMRPGQAPLQISLDTEGEHMVEFAWDPQAPSGVSRGRQLPIAGRLTVRAPGGQVVERLGGEFLAPEKGWSEEGVLARGCTPPTGSWSVVNGNQQFYIRYGDGTHARIEVGAFATSEGCKLVSESTYNDNPASRWLYPSRP